MFLRLNSSYVDKFFSAHRQNISLSIKSVPSLAFIVEYCVALLFCINSKLFIIELCSPGDRKVLNQHVPLTEAELLIFPERLFTSLDKSRWGGLSFAPATQSLFLVRYRVVCSSVRHIMYLSILHDSVIKEPTSGDRRMFKTGVRL